MTVIKDCTGMYLRFQEKDYHVCNTESLEGFSNGTEVEASFKRINECAADTGVVCLMLHPNEGWVKVTKIE